MASLRFETDRSRKGWRLQFYTLDKRKRSLWIGDVSKKKATDTQRFVEDLLDAKRLGRRPDGDAALWVEGLEGRMRSSLAKFGLCKPAEPKQSHAAATQLGPFIDYYLSLRTDLKPITIKKFNQVRVYATKYLGEERLLELITQADFEQWIRWMRTPRKAADGKTVEPALADATSNKHAKRLRQILEYAVKGRLLKVNPGEGCKLGAEVNEARQFYITAEMSNAIIAHCTEVNWKLIFALPRYLGLRCPTEVLGLRWSDVDWERGRLRIDSVKTGLRECPIFPAIRPILEEAWNEAARDSPTGQPSRDAHVISRTPYSSVESNMRTQLSRVIIAAGYEPWEKLFVNLRSSCRTDLEELFPGHVVDKWLGHSSRVAKQHYLQVTDDHWARALNTPGGSTGGSKSQLGGSTGGDTQTLSKKQGVKQTAKKQAQASQRGSERLGLCPRKDSNLGPAD